MGKERSLLGNLFLISVVTLAFETVVFRIFAFLFGYHFVSLLLALALLGYGVAGSVGMRIPLSFKENLPGALGCSLIFFFLGLCLLPLDPYGLFLRPFSLLALGGMLLFTLLPFFWHGLVQVVAFERFPRHFSRFYGFNLLGSAVGVGVGLGGLWFLEESRVILLLALIGVLGRMRMVWRVAFAGFLLLIFFSPLQMYRSPYSPSLLLREIPENTLLKTYRNPVETMEVFSTPSSRVGWGLSVRFAGVPPSSFTLVFDHHFSETFPTEHPEPFLEALLLALPFRVARPERVLLLEGKGGLEGHLAHHFGASTVELVTSSFLFAAFLRDFVPDFPAQVVVATPRRYLQKRENTYDGIVVQVPVGRASVFPGSFSFAENFLLTREGVEALFLALKEEGMLVFPIFLQNPPSLLPKLVTLLATVVELDSRLVVVKNLDCAFVVVRKKAWESATLNAFKEEVNRWHFDFIYFPGGKEEDFETVFQTGKRYYRALKEALEGEAENTFFDLRPPRDHRPYFGNFFRFSQLPETWRNLGKRWLPFGGAGFLLFIAVFVLVLCFSVLGILLPVRGLVKEAIAFRRKILLGGICTGVGFMFVEMALFVRLSLVVGLPLYTFSLLLLLLLCGSGWGSMQVGRGLSRERVKTYAFLHLATMGGYFLLLRFFGSESFLLLPLLPLAYWSGMPFPLLSQFVRRKAPALFPALFAYNGFFSVISSLLAHLLLLFWGAELVFSLTFLVYLTFWVILLALPG